MSPVSLWWMWLWCKLAQSEVISIQTNSSARHYLGRLSCYSIPSSILSSQIFTEEIVQSSILILKNQFGHSASWVKKTACLWPGQWSSSMESWWYAFLARVSQRQPVQTKRLCLTLKTVQREVFPLAGYLLGRQPFEVFPGFTKIWRGGFQG